MKKYIFGLVFIISCSASERGSTDLADNLSTFSEDTTTTSSIISSKIDNEDTETCLQFKKEIMDVYESFKVISFSMEEFVEKWFESKQTLSDSSEFKDSLNILNEQALVPLNTKVQNLVPNSNNLIIQNKWLELIIRTNKTMDLFLIGLNDLNNLDFFSISQGRTFIKVINKDFDSIPDLNDC
tara:strand:+ start:44 stop:592 length:549 start_codon:yes stop_codon:yes gene_type:complete